LEVGALVDAGFFGSSRGVAGDSAKASVASSADGFESGGVVGDFLFWPAFAETVASPKTLVGA
jgi:hypothetical protein